MEAAIQVLEAPELRNSFDAIAGGETAGIPYAAILADRLRLPMVYIRKKSKEYGTRSRIEGALSRGSRVLLFEDLVSDGGSKLSFISALREDGCSVAYCLVVFEYGLPDCRRLLKAEGIDLISLVDCRAVLHHGMVAGLVNQEAAKAVEVFLRNPTASE